MKKKLCSRFMRVYIDMINTGGVKGAGPPYDPMDFIFLGKKKFCQVRTVLSGDTGNECFLHSIASTLKIT